MVSYLRLAQFSHLTFEACHFELCGVLVPRNGIFFHWSRMASYSAIITSGEVIIAGGQTFKIAASRFVDVSEEEINLMKENTITRNTKHAILLSCLEHIEYGKRTLRLLDMR